jgi:peptide/nickel transport system ATP-binding protein
VPELVLEARGLRKEYGELVAVDGVDLAVPSGGSLAIVGESGSGKTTVAKMLVGLTTPTAGTIVACGHDRSTPARSARERRRRGSEVQIVFQDPYSSLDPRQTAEQAIGEVLRLHRGGEKAGRATRVRELCELVGLPASAVGRYPHEFSGGQRQRIAIARTLAADPSVIVLDEPLASLDASAQAQLANLLLDLSRNLGLGLLLISHDLAIVRHVSDSVSVMYLGRMVETGETRAVWERPLHPYTESLVNAIPHPDGRGFLPAALPGEVPDPVDPPSGCRFHPRCPYAFGRCPEEEPPLVALAGGREAACWLQPPGASPASPAARVNLSGPPESNSVTDQETATDPPGGA